MERSAGFSSCEKQRHSPSVRDMADAARGVLRRRGKDGPGDHSSTIKYDRDLAGLKQPEETAGNV